MKKILLVSIILLALPSLMNAQFGMKVGFNLSYFNGSNDFVSNRSSRIGFQGGLMYKIPIKDDVFSIQPEIIVIQKGGQFTIEQYKVDAKLDYIEFPILGMFNILGGLLNLQAGPQFSWLNRAEYKYTDENNITNSFDDKELDNYKTFDIGVVLGVGLELEIVTIEARYSVGFLEVERKFEYNGQPIDPASKNFNAQFIIGYYF